MRHDFRDSSRAKYHREQVCSRGYVRLMTFNIERGYQLEKIVEQIRVADADIISIQEIDIQCERSGNKDVGAEIASQIGLNYVFGCFLSLSSLHLISSITLLVVFSP